MPNPFREGAILKQDIYILKKDVQQYNCDYGVYHTEICMWFLFLSRSFHCRKKMKQGLMVKRRVRKRLRSQTSQKQISVKIAKSPTLLRQEMISQQRFLLQWRSTKKCSL
jgi:hypothetical protein